MRENRTHGSEGGDGESRSRPLSGGRAAGTLDSGFRRNDGGKLKFLLPGFS